MRPLLGSHANDSRIRLVHATEIVGMDESPALALRNKKGEYVLLNGNQTLVLLMSYQLTRWAERGLFGDEPIFATTTPYQRLVVTRWKDDTRLHINGNLQFSSRDEHRYHEALVHPAMAAHGAARRSWLRRLYERLLTRLAHLIVAFQSPR